jgi:hypothetical protein
MKILDYVFDTKYNGEVLPPEDVGIIKNEMFHLETILMQHPLRFQNIISLLRSSPNIQIPDLIMFMRELVGHFEKDDFQTRVFSMKSQQKRYEGEVGKKSGDTTNWTLGKYLTPREIKSLNFYGIKTKPEDFINVSLPSVLKEESNTKKTGDTEHVETIKTEENMVEKYVGENNILKDLDNEIIKFLDLAIFNISVINDGETFLLTLTGSDSVSYYYETPYLIDMMFNSEKTIFKNDYFMKNNQLHTFQAFNQNEYYMLKNAIEKSFKNSTTSKFQKLLQQL